MPGDAGSAARFERVDSPIAGSGPAALPDVRGAARHGEAPLRTREWPRARSRELAISERLSPRMATARPGGDIRESVEQAVCPRCKSELEQQFLYQRFRVCGSCHQHFSLSARRRLELLVDEGTFRETNHR